jgi:hypothetical protein
MGKEQKIIERIIAKINKNVNAIPWTCIIEGCNEKAINSHILQKNGVLSNIESQGHVYEIKPLDVFKWSELNFGAISFFKRLSISQVHCYPTLCNLHDTQIFHSIETHPLNFSNYKINLLFAFRTLLSMIRKEEIVLKKENRIVNSKVIRANKASDSVINISNQNICVIEELLTLRQEQLSKFQEDIQNGTQNFNYIELSYPFKEVYSSSIHLSPNNLEHIYINIIPYDGNCKILIFYPINPIDT